MFAPPPPVPLQGIEFLSAPADIVNVVLDPAGLTDAGLNGGARTAVVGSGTNRLTASNDVTGARDFEREGNQVCCREPTSHARAIFSTASAS